MPKLIRPWLERISPASCAGAAALVVFFLAASHAGAVTLTPLSGDSFASGEIVGSLGPFSQTDTSMALEPLLSIEEFRASGNVGVQVFLSATIATGLAIPEVVVSSGETARTSGDTNNTAMSHGYTLNFSLDGPALARLRNGNSTGGFPRALAAEAIDSAALSYELRTAGGATVFLYTAPPTNSAGTYAEATIPAGSYSFIVTGSAAAIGDPCCVLHGAQAGGTVRLEFEDAPAPVPMFGGLGGAVLVGLLSLVGARRIRTRA